MDASAIGGIGKDNKIFALGRLKMPSAAGDRIGPYTILEKLGAGGMGEVYKARDVRLKRVVALKVLLPNGLRDASSDQRFAQEARGRFLLKPSQHRHDLRYGLRLNEVLRYGMQIGDALAKAHAARESSIAI
jgi:serine/threonine protein kinase